MSSDLVPAPGLSVTLSTFQSGQRFGLIGPFPKGVLLRRLVCTLAATPTSGVMHLAEFAATYGGERDASIAGLDAGVSVVQRSSPSGVWRTPIWTAALDGPLGVSWAFPIGVRTRTGSVFFVCAINIAPGSCNGSITFGVEVWAPSDRRKDEK